MKSAGSDEEEDNDDEKVETNFTGQPRLAEVPANGHVEKRCVLLQFMLKINVFPPASKILHFLLLLLAMTSCITPMKS
jgi:hypothetical protein